MSNNCFVPEKMYTCMYSIQLIILSEAFPIKKKKVVEKND